MVTSCVYKIQNLVNGRLYIGSAANFEVRKSTHISQLRSHKHGNQFLQRAWDKYGENSFRFEIVEICAKDNLLKLEQEYLDMLDVKNLYNILPIAGSSLGVKRTEKYKLKRRGPHLKCPYCENLRLSKFSKQNKHCYLKTCGSKECIKAAKSEATIATHTKVNEAIKNQIYSLRDQNLSSSRIAKILSLGTTTIKRYLKVRSG